MTRMLAVLVLLSGCAEAQPAVGPPSIRAGIWPWFYSATPRPAPAVRQDIRAGAVKVQQPAQEPPDAQIPIEKLDQARDKLRAIQQQLNKPTTATTVQGRLNE